MKINTAGGVYLMAYNSAGVVNGDAANITATVYHAGTSIGASATAHPTGLGGGAYWLPLTDSECNAAALAVVAASTTSGVSIAPVFTDTSEAMRGTDSALTALPAAPTDWLSAAAVAAAAVTKIQNGLATPTNITAASGVALAASQQVLLANGAHGGAAATITLQTPIAATVPDTQKVDVNTIKTHAVTAATPVAVAAYVGTAAANTAQTGDAYARLGAPAGASVSADVAAVKTDTAGISGVAAAVWSVGTRTLTGFGALVADVATAVWGAATRILTANTNLSIPAAAPSAADNADAVLNELLADHTTPGSLSAKLAALANADLSGLALETTLTDIKGEGWTNETLEVIKASADAANRTTPPTADANATATAARILAHPMRLLETKEDGSVVADVTLDPTALTPIVADALVAAGLKPSANAVTWTSEVFLDKDGNPADGVEVWLCSNEDRTGRVFVGTTSSAGMVMGLVDPGTYWQFTSVTGYQESKKQITVEAPA